MNRVPQKTENVVLTREEIYKAAIAHYRSAFPTLDAYEVIASRMYITPKNLRAKVAGERHFSVHEEEMLFAVCLFPEGFNLKCNFVFHPKNSKPRRG
jgi:hypothetical protein